jgi:hypothetical protein
MKTVKIDVLRSGSAGTDEKVLIKSLEVQVESDKPLNAKSATQLIKRVLPEFGELCHMRKTEEGWMTSRAVAPTAKCKYHYTWEHARIRKEQ